MRIYVHITISIVIDNLVTYLVPVETLHLSQRWPAAPDFVSAPSFHPPPPRAIISRVCSLFRHTVRERERLCRWCSTTYSGLFAGSLQPVIPMILIVIFPFSDLIYGMNHWHGSWTIGENMSSGNAMRPLGYQYSIIIYVYANQIRQEPLVVLELLMRIGCATQTILWKYQYTRSISNLPIHMAWFHQIRNELTVNHFPEVHFVDQNRSRYEAISLPSIDLQPSRIIYHGWPHSPCSYYTIYSYSSLSLW